MMDRLKRHLEGYIWWHRVRGHEVASSGAYDLFGNISTGCLTCHCRWRHTPFSIVYYPPGQHV